MTTLDPRLLAACVDGELDAADAAEVQAAIDADPALAAQVDEHRRLRDRLQAAYQGTLDEAVPQRLLQALHVPSSAVPSAADHAAASAPRVDLATAREARSRRQSAPDRPPRSTWAQWGGMAASLLVGLVLGLLLPFNDAASPFESASNGLLARGAVADALTNQLASDASPDAAIRLQISFIDQAGRHCRTFTTAALAGLACRDGGDWAMQSLLRVDPAAGQPVMRQAATALPVELLNIVDQRMRGEAFDATAERAARERNWQR